MLSSSVPTPTPCSFEPASLTCSRCSHPKNFFLILFLNWLKSSQPLKPSQDSAHLSASGLILDSDWESPRVHSYLLSSSSKNYSMYCKGPQGCFSNFWLYRWRNQGPGRWNCLPKFKKHFGDRTRNRILGSFCFPLFLSFVSWCR